MLLVLTQGRSQPPVTQCLPTPSAWSRSTRSAGTHRRMLFFLGMGCNLASGEHPRESCLTHDPLTVASGSRRPLRLPSRSLPVCRRSQVTCGTAFASWTTTGTTCHLQPAGRPCRRPELQTGEDAFQAQRESRFTEQETPSP